MRSFRTYPPWSPPMATGTRSGVDTGAALAASAAGKRVVPGRPPQSGVHDPADYLAYFVGRGPSGRRYAWSSTHCAVASSVTIRLTRAVLESGEGDGAAARSGGDAHAKGLVAEVLERQADGAPVERREGDPALEGDEPAENVADRSGVGELLYVDIAEITRGHVDAVGPEDSHSEDGGPGGASRRQGVPDGRVAFERVAEFRGADDRRGGHESDRGPARPPELLHDFLSSGGARGARDGAVELDDLGGAGPALAEACRDLQHRSAPGDTDCAGRLERGQMNRGGAGDVRPGKQLLVGIGASRRHVDDDGAAQAEPDDEGVLQLNQAGGRVHDLNADCRLAQGAVQEAPDLEPADAEAPADLVLGQMERVVEIGGAEHEPGLQSQFILAENRAVCLHAQMCNLLRIC